jgi:hypothetical protein
VRRHRLRFLLTGGAIALAALALTVFLARSGEETVAAKVSVPEPGGVSVPPEASDLAVPTLSYSAKFVCGQGQPDALVPANYHTAVNIHNAIYQDVTLTKKVVYALPEWWLHQPNHYPPPPSSKIPVTLGADEAFEIDCQDIVAMQTPPGIFPYFKGFVVIETATTEPVLEVVAVYTANSTSVEVGRGIGVGQGMDVERVTPKYQQSPPQEGPTWSPAYQYAAKFICGQETEGDGYDPVAPGLYMTAVNIHNFWELEETRPLYKKVVLAPPERSEQPPLILWLPNEVLQPDGAIEVDCADIWIALSGSGSSWPYSPLKGFVVVYSNRELDVTAVYSARDYISTTQGVGIGLGLDVEEVPYTRVLIPL